MSSDNEKYAEMIGACEPLFDELFARCDANAPNLGVQEEWFKNSLRKSARKFLATDESATPSLERLKDFLSELFIDDLFLAIACANGNERAWWEFDQQHRPYMERVARHLARTDIDAQEVIDTVYVELYGTRVIDGERVSKFASYDGRSSLRGWLRTVVWHCVVDLHRASHDEVSLDEMTEKVGEGVAHASFVEANLGGEEEMIERISKDRYRKATLTSIENAFANLDAHEKLLLLYYHVENMKLREIARMVENVDSPLRGWFRRKSATRVENPSSKIHESTIMRWLEKSYAKLLSGFRTELVSAHALNAYEVEVCMELVTEDQQHTIAGAKKKILGELTKMKMAYLEHVEDKITEDYFGEVLDEREKEIERNEQSKMSSQKRVTLSSFASHLLELSSVMGEKKHQSFISSLSDSLDVSSENLSETEIQSLIKIEVPKEFQDLILSLTKLEREKGISGNEKILLDELIQIYEQFLLIRSQALCIAVERDVMKPLSQ